MKTKLRPYQQATIDWAVGKADEKVDTRPLLAIWADIIRRYRIERAGPGIGWHLDGPTTITPPDGAPYRLWQFGPLFLVEVTR